MIQTDQQLLTYSCAHLAHRYVILREDKLCGDQMHSWETRNEPLLGSNLPAQQGLCRSLIFSPGLSQKASLSPEGLWVMPGTCPHLQVALGCSLPRGDQNLDTISDSHDQAGFPGELLRAQAPGRGKVFPQYRLNVHKLCFIRGLFFRYSPFVTVAEGLGPFAKLHGPKASSVNGAHP